MLAMFFQRGCSSVDRVLASEAKGRGFDPRQPRHAFHHDQCLESKCDIGWPLVGRWLALPRVMTRLARSIRPSSLFPVSYHLVSYYLISYYLICQSACRLKFSPLDEGVVTLCLIT
jgi:hypothetical protein